MHPLKPLAILCLLGFLAPGSSHAASVVHTGGVSTTGFVSATQVITTNISLTTGATTWGYISNTGSYLPKLATDRISTTSVSATRITITTPPTAVSDAATKAYVDAVTAAGTSSRLTYMGTTPSVYQGNLGGPAGANAKCNAAFPGSRMMTTSEIIRADYNSVSMTTAGWIFCDEINYQPSLENGYSADYTRYMMNNTMCRGTVLGQSGRNGPSIMITTYPNCTDFFSNAADSNDGSNYYYQRGTTSSNGALYTSSCTTSQTIHCVK